MQENTVKASSLAKLEEMNGKLAKEVKQREHAMVALQSQVEDLKAKSSPRGVGRSPRMVRYLLIINGFCCCGAVVCCVECCTEMRM